MSRMALIYPPKLTTDNDLKRAYRYPHAGEVGDIPEEWNSGQPSFTVGMYM